MESFYREADRYFVVNSGDGLKLDPDLTPIIISLPGPPKDKTKIKNYGLPPDEQYYRRDEIPPGIETLSKKVLKQLLKRQDRNKARSVTGHKIIKAFWATLEENAEDYEKEIDFIKKTIWKTIYGEWIYIDGKPTYITGWHYEYLNFWYMPDVLGTYPEYRDKDRLIYLFNHYLYTTDETFADLDDEGYAQKDSNGIYRIKHTGRRLFYGSIQPKNRRSGASHQALESMWAIIRKSLGMHGVIISKSTDDMEKHFKTRLIPAWQHYPIFLKPTWNGTNSPENNLVLSAPANEYSYNGLGSSIFYPRSVSEAVIDSQKIGVALFDEQGKSTGGGKVDVFDRWETSKQTMSTGNGAIIYGYSFNPSTCEEMEEGAVNYKMMCDLSNFYQRQPNGQTKSGLALLYFPAQVALEGFIGPFGESIINKPTERQIKLSRGLRDVYAKMGIGSFAFLRSERDKLLSSGTEADKKKYRLIRRKHPMRYAESWLGSSGDMGWNIEKVDARLIELNRMKITKELQKKVKRGRFKRLNGERDGTVVWETDPDGPFEISMELPREETNQKKRILWNDPVVGHPIQAWEPKNKYRFTCGCDPFDYGGKKESKQGRSVQSDGGIAVLWEYDPSIEKSEIEKEWDSRSFVLSYRYRPSTLQEYNEDVLMACIYYGAMLYPERNKTGTWQYFVERGYGGYLKYNYNPLTGRREEKPGFYSLSQSKQNMFVKIKDFINNRIHKDLFIAWLEEIKAMNSPEDMTKLDRLTAHGAALLGSEAYNAKKRATGKDNVININRSSFFRKRAVF